METNQVRTMNAADSALAALASAADARLLIAGDTHGNANWLEVLFNQALANRCSAMIQLGDFGFWPHQRDGQRFVRRLDFLAKRVRIPLLWIDGNHENHDALDELPRLDDGTVRIADWIRYLPRGHRFTIGETRFGCLGGAFSIDWRRRVLGVSWWQQEVVTEEDVARLGLEPLDVLLTHDAPGGVPISSLELPPTDELRADANRRLVGQAVGNTRPHLVLHGHWHYRYGYDLQNPVCSFGDRPDAELGRADTRVEGLASDQEHDGSAWGVLELPSLEFRDGHQFTVGPE